MPRIAIRLSILLLVTGPVGAAPSRADRAACGRDGPSQALPKVVRSAAFPYSLDSAYASPADSGLVRFRMGECNLEMGSKKVKVDGQSIHLLYSQEALECFCMGQQPSYGTFRLPPLPPGTYAVYTHVLPARDACDSGCDLWRQPGRLEGTLTSGDPATVQPRARPRRTAKSVPCSADGRRMPDRHAPVPPFARD